tara:strand:- start:786 stop:1331 length:546 start_codon:yes stop_codon:yes gene_type:complete
MVEFEFNATKFEQALLLLMNAANNGLLGKTKLFKLLYYADFDHFERYGSPITGETYLRYEYGPFPSHGNKAIDGLRQGELINTQPILVGSYLQFTYQPLARADVSVFAPEEISTLLDVASKWERHNATEMVAATHGEAPWVATAANEAISYALAYYRNKFGEMDEFAEEDADKAVPIEDVG